MIVEALLSGADFSLNPGRVSMISNSVSSQTPIASKGKTKSSSASGEQMFMWPPSIVSLFSGCLFQDCSQKPGRTNTCILTAERVRLTANQTIPESFYTCVPSVPTSTEYLSTYESPDTSSVKEEIPVRSVTKKNETVSEQKSADSLCSSCCKYKSKSKESTRCSSGSKENKSCNGTAVPISPAKSTETPFNDTLERFRFRAAARRYSESVNQANKAQPNMDRRKSEGTSAGYQSMPTRKGTSEPGSAQKLENHSRRHLGTVDVSMLKISRDRRGELVDLGRGAYGRVVLGVYKHYSVAIKLFVSPRVSSADVYREAETLSYLQSTGVVPRLFGLMPPDKALTPLPAIVMEQISSSLTLHNLMYTSNKGLLRNQWLHIALQLTSAVELLHRKGVLYNDLKLDNVLVQTRDRGYSVYLTDVGDTSGQRGLIYDVPDEDHAIYYHLAPEVLSRRPTSKASDVYSLGVALRQMMRVSRTEACLRGLVLECLCVNPLERLSAEQIRHRLVAIIVSEGM